MFTAINIDCSIKQTLFTEAGASIRARPNMVLRNTTIPNRATGAAAHLMPKTHIPKVSDSITVKNTSAMTMSMSSGNSMSISSSNSYSFKS
jgi:hypothetical protein